MKTDSNFGSVCLLLKGRSGSIQDFGPFTLEVAQASNASFAVGTGYSVIGYFGNTTPYVATPMYTCTLPEVANRGTNDWSLEFHILTDTYSYSGTPLLDGPNATVKLTSGNTLAVYTGSTLALTAPHPLSYYSTSDFTAVQICKHSGTLYLLINGAVATSASDSHSWDWSGNWNVIDAGCQGVRMDNLRFSTIARNYATYTVDNDFAELPSYGFIADPLWPGVALLLQPDGAGITDASSYSTAITQVGSLTIDAYDRWLQGGAINFNGSSYIEIAQAVADPLGMNLVNSMSVSYEIVIKFSTLLGGVDVILSKIDSALNYGWILYKDASGNINFDTYDAGALYSTQTLFTASSGYNILYVCTQYGNIYFGYAATTVSVESSLSWAGGEVAPLWLGAGYALSGSTITQEYLIGHIASVRFNTQVLSGTTVLYGTRVQEGYFYELIPTLPYGTQAVPSSASDTRLLCHFDGSTVAAALTDSSTYGLTLSKDAGTDFAQDIGNGQFGDSTMINMSDVNYTTPNTFPGMPTSGSFSVNSSEVNFGNDVWSIEITCWGVAYFAAGSSTTAMSPIFEWGSPSTDGNRIGMGYIYHEDTQNIDTVIWVQAPASYDSSGLTGVTETFTNTWPYTLALFKTGPWLYLYSGFNFLNRFVIPDAWGIAPGNEWIFNAGRMNNAVFNGTSNDGVLHYGMNEFDELRMLDGGIPISGTYLSPLAAFSLGGVPAALEASVTVTTNATLDTMGTGAISASIFCGSSASLLGAAQLHAAISVVTNDSLSLPPWVGAANVQTTASLRPNWPEARASVSVQMQARLITPIPTDPLWNNVILLVKGRDDGSGVVKDLSSLEHSLTVSGGIDNYGDGVQGYGCVSNVAEASPLIQTVFGAEAVMGTGDWSFEFYGGLGLGGVGTFVELFGNGTHVFGFVNSTGIMELQHAGTTVLTSVNSFSSYTSTTGSAFFQVTKHAGTIYLFVNGTLDISASDSNSWDWSGTFQVFNNTYDPYIDDLRVTAGISRNSVAYSPGAEFPQYPFINHFAEAFFDFVTLLFQPDGTSGFTDVSNQGLPLTVMGYPSTSFHFRKYAPGSLFFSSGYSMASGSYAFSDNYLLIDAADANAAGLAFDNAYLTLEIWFGLMSSVATDGLFYPIISKVDSGLTRGWQLVRDTDNTIRFKIYSGGSMVTNANLGTMTAGFHKLVLNEVGQHWTVALDSGLTLDLGTIAFPPSTGDAAPALIGAGYSAASTLKTLNGYINSVRFTNAQARFGLYDSDVGQHSQMYYPLASTYTAPNSILAANVFCSTSAVLKIPMTASCGVVTSASGTLTNEVIVISCPLTVNVLSMNWQLSCPLFVDVFAVYQISCGLTVNVTGFTLSCALQVDVFAVYQISCPMTVNVFPVYASGLGGQSVGEVVQLPPGNVQHWKLQVMLNGVDVSDRLTGTCSIDAEESAAVIATFALRPVGGVVDPYAWTKAPVTITYFETDSNGNTLYSSLLYRGIVDTPIYNPTTRVVEFTCTDNLQNKVMLMTEPEIDAVTPLSQWNWWVFNIDETVWQYLQDRVSTYPYAYGIDINGNLYTYDWQAGKILYEFTAHTIIDGSLEVLLANSRDITNTVYVNADWQMDVFRETVMHIHWEETGYTVEEIAPEYLLCSAQMICDAVTNAGAAFVVPGAGTPNASYPRFWMLPPSHTKSVGSTGQMYESMNYGTELDAIGFDGLISKRYIQNVNNELAVTVVAAGSVASIGTEPTNLSVEIQAQYNQFIEDLFTQQDTGQWFYCTAGTGYSSGYDSVADAPPNRPLLFTSNGLSAGGWISYPVLPVDMTFWNMGRSQTGYIQQSRQVVDYADYDYLLPTSPGTNGLYQTQYTLDTTDGPTPGSLYMPGDHIYDFDSFITLGNAADRESSYNILVAQAQTLILASMRQNRVQFKTYMFPSVQRGQTMRVATAPVTATGIVHQYVHEFNIQEGSALTTISLALSSEKSIGIAPITQVDNIQLSCRLQVNVGINLTPPFRGGYPNWNYAMQFSLLLNSHYYSSLPISSGWTGHITPFGIEGPNQFAIQFPALPDANVKPATVVFQQPQITVAVPQDELVLMV